MKKINNALANTLLIINLSIFNVSKANENNSNYSCKWENKNDVPVLKLLA